LYIILLSFVLERLRSSEEKVPFDSTFDLRDRPAASLETDVSIAVSRDCRYRKPGEVLLIQLERRKMLLCVGALSAFGNDGLLSRGNWRTSTMGIVSPRKVSRKQTSHICIIGESANNQTTPGSFPDRRSFDHVDFLVSGSCTHPKLSLFHLGNVNPRGTCEIVCVSRD